MGECGICLEPFTDERGIRVPLVRACGHTHCRHCFTLLPHPAQCPTCRQVMSCEPQVNYALVAILASLDAQKADVSPEPSRTPAEPRAATSFLAAIARTILNATDSSRTTVVSEQVLVSALRHLPAALTNAGEEATDALHGEGSVAGGCSDVYLIRGGDSSAVRSASARALAAICRKFSDDPQGRCWAHQENDLFDALATTVRRQPSSSEEGASASEALEALALQHHGAESTLSSLRTARAVRAVNTAAVAAASIVAPLQNGRVNDSRPIARSPVSAAITSHSARLASTSAVRPVRRAPSSSMSTTAAAATLSASNTSIPTATSASEKAALRNDNANHHPPSPRNDTLPSKLIASPVRVGKKDGNCRSRTNSTATASHLSPIMALYQSALSQGRGAAHAEALVDMLRQQTLHVQQPMSCRPLPAGTSSRPRSAPRPRASAKTQRTEKPATTTTPRAGREHTKLEAIYGGGSCRRPASAPRSRPVRPALASPSRKSSNRRVPVAADGVQHRQRRSSTLLPSPQPLPQPTPHSPPQLREMPRPRSAGSGASPPQQQRSSPYHGRIFRHIKSPTTLAPAVGLP